MEHTIRQLRVGDRREAELLAAMWNASESGWPGSWTRGIPETADRVLERLAKQDRLVVLVAEVDGEIVGYCDLAPQRGRDDVAYVDLLNVRPDCHGKGLGKALLLAVIERCVALGFRQVTLDTWSGNLKAVPLYKKCGFFWVPETDVWMQNYIPTVLALPLARLFFERHDWYRSLRRDLAVVPDEVEWNGVKVFPYRFEEEGERLTVWIDREAEAPTAVETDDLYVACIVGKEEVVCGLEHTVRWEIENRRGRARAGTKPVQVTLIAEGEPGIGLSLMESLAVHDRVVIERPLMVAPDIRPKEPGLPAPQIRTTVLVEGVPVALGAAVKAVQPVQIEYSGQAVVAGKPDEKVVVRLGSRLDFPVAGELLIDPHPSLRFDRLVAPFTLEPRSWASGTLYVRADGEGAFGTRMVARCWRTDGPESAAKPLMTAPKPVTLRTIPLTGVYAWHDEEEKALVVETPGYWARVALRGGQMALHDRLSGRPLLSCRAPELGPPFTEWRPVESTYSHRLEQRDGAVVLTLVVPSDDVPGLVVERTFTFGAGGFVRVDHRILNRTDSPYRGKLSCPGWTDLAGTLTLPLRDGLIHEPVEGEGGFPLWDGDLPKRPDDYAETWCASEESGLVAGIVWHEAEECRQIALQIALPEIPGRSCYDLEPIYLVAGRGNWELVRQLWRWLKQPGAVREERRPLRHPVLEARLDPAPTLVVAPETPARLFVQNRRGKALSGSVRLGASGLDITPAAIEVADVKLGAPFFTGATVRTRDLTARVVDVRLSLSDGVTAREFPSPVVVLGDASRPVQVSRSETGAGAPEGFIVGNGLLSLTVSPAFFGSVTRLETASGAAVECRRAGRRDRPGTNHLASAYPQPRARSWMNPWYGGIHPFLGWCGSPRFFKETFSGEPTERKGARGFTWRGVRVVCDLQHKDDRWLRLEVEYLALGGSNVVALVVRAVNRTNAPHGALVGVASWLAVGGDPEANVLHYEEERPRAGHAVGADERERVVRSRARSEQMVQLRRGRWAAVQNPPSGDTLALIASHQNGWVQPGDEGRLGVCLQTGAWLDLEPRETKEAISWLVWCGSVDEALAYRALGEVWELP